MRALALVALVAAGCGATIGVGAGNALVAPGTTGGATSTVRLYDRGGPISRLVLRTLAGFGAATAGVTSTSSVTSESSRTECYGSSCQKVTTTHITTTVTVDRDKARAAAEAYDRLDQDISNTPYRGFPFETILEISSRDVGGDTSGWMLWYWYHGKPRAVGSMAVAFSVGFGTGSLDFHDRTRTTLVGDSASVTPVETMVTPEHYYLGTPVRISVYPRNDVWLYLQPDLNWAAVWEDWFAATLDDTSDIEANPWRLGVRARWLGVEIGGELLTDGMSAGARTLSAEVGYVF